MWWNKVFVLVLVFNFDTRAAIIAVVESESNDKVCETPGCVRAAEKILEKIDNTIEPCDNFYNFACGNYVKKTKIPDDESNVDTFSIVRDILKDQLKTIITAPIEKDDIEPFKMVKKLYSACMDKKLIEDRGLKPINDIMDSMGGWPAVKGDSWDEKSWTWQKSILDCRKNGYSNDYLLDFSVGTDLKNSSSRIAYVSEA